MTYMIYMTYRTQIKVTKPKFLNASIEETPKWKTITNHWSDLTHDLQGKFKNVQHTILPPDDGLSTLGRDKAKDYKSLVRGSDQEYW